MVSPAEFVTKVRELTDADPEHVYQRPDHDGFSRCLYTNDPEAQDDDQTAYGCLFGQAMRQLGHPVPREYEGASISKVAQRHFGWGADREARVTMKAIDEAQDAQDEGEPWGHARAKMDAILDEG